jgi:hypothetical protein
MKDESTVRLRAAERCYALAAHHAPGSTAADAAEQAILYVLSARRRADDGSILVRDALHDGARTVSRAQRSLRRVEHELTYLARQGVATAGSVGEPSTDEVLDRVVARETLKRLQDHAAGLGGFAPRVLAGMLLEESELETAAAIGSSRATVTRLRRALREGAAATEVLPATA